MSYIDYALMNKALGDPTRLQIFDMLKNGKMCACDILDEFSITQPTLSYHMKMLTDSGLVLSEKDSKWIHYSINKPVLNDLINFIGKTASDTKRSCKKCK